MGLTKTEPITKLVFGKKLTLERVEDFADEEEIFRGTDCRGN